jgi:phosphoglycolate phosphatase-like HAD superfamily hydrolase
MPGLSLRARRAPLVALFLTLASFGCEREPSLAREARADEPQTTAAPAAPDPLPAWNDGPVKRSIIDFVHRVTKPSSPAFIPSAERIATFDNDGTLWSEQPTVELAFIIDRVKELAPLHPEWTRQEPFKSILAGRPEAIAASGERGVLELLAATHAGMTTDQFQAIVDKWIVEARDPRFKRPYTDLVYQPMLEVLRYLESNGFTTYIVSGGGAEFMRAFAGRVYGIPPERVIGSTGKLKYELRSGRPALIKLPEVEHVDDKGGKPIAIQRFIGARPIAAFGNSDGDQQMLEWTTLGTRGARFGMIIHHTDGEREFAYDRGAALAKLSSALDAAPQRGWVVVDMKRDWKFVYPFQHPDK